MENFVAIAAGLDVAPSLAALAALDPLFWVDLMGDGGRYVLLLGADRKRRHEAALAPVWTLVDAARGHAAVGHGDAGALAYVRVGRMPPGGRVLPHADGMDGVVDRRYQIVLQAAPGGAITLGGEARCLAAGEVWQLDVAKLHHVDNASDLDRIVVVFDSRAETA